MKNYVVFSKKDGTILKTGSCPVSMYALQLDDPYNYDITEGVVDDRQDRIDVITKSVCAKTYVEKTITEELQTAEAKLRSVKLGIINIKLQTEMASKCGYSDIELESNEALQGFLEELENIELFISSRSLPEEINDTLATTK